MRRSRVMVVLVAVLTVGALVGGCSSNSSRGGHLGDTSSGGGSSDSSSAGSPAVVNGILGKEYKHGVALISVGGFTRSSRTPPSGQAWFDITGLQLSSDAKPLTFRFVVACDGRPVGSLVPNTHDQDGSRDGKTITLPPGAGAGASDTYVQVPSACTKPTVTISAPGIGAVRYRVPPDVLTTG